jgi:hypothetical protein
MYLSFFLTSNVLMPIIIFIIFGYSKSEVFILDKKNKQSKGELYVPIQDFKVPDNNDAVPVPGTQPPKAP